MRTYFRYSLLALVALLVLSLVVCGGLSAPTSAAGATYYVDCSAASNGDGSQSSPWNNLATVNGTTFSPGDTILFKRGTTCSGTLQPGGSGADGSPITLGAYGSGPLPIIDGGSNLAALKLYDQEYWHIQDLEVTGGTKYGIHITGSGNGMVMDHFRLTNLVVHDVWGGTIDTKCSGLVLFEAIETGSDTFSDIVIDGVTAYNTNQWAGIEVFGGPHPISIYSADVTIRNSTVHDVYGDGIVIWIAQNGLIENSTAYETGKEPTYTVGTPAGIWTWACKTCTVQFNESYLTHTPEWDGGCYDIDYHNKDNTYQYNYGHDCDGSGIYIFGAENDVTTNPVIRYNIFSNDNREDHRYHSNLQGEIYTLTWNSGKIGSPRIYNNTVYFNPYATDAYAIWFDSSSQFVSSDNYFYNNIVYSEAPNLMYTNKNHFILDYNIWWHTGGAPKWKYFNKVYSDFASYQSGSGMDAHGMYTDPKLNNPTYHGVGRPTTEFTLQSDSPAIDAGADLVALGYVSSMGARDFFGNAIPANGVYDIGAYEADGSPPSPTDTPVPPTDTPIPPTDTPGPTPTPTDTPLPPTDTPIPPTDTPAPPTDTPTPTATPGGSTTMHVEDIYTTDANGTPKDVFKAKDTIYWQAQVLDQNGDPVEGASVTSDIIKPDGSVWKTYTYTTDADGWAYFSQKTAPPSPKGTYTVTVTNVTKDGATYDPSANVKDTHQCELQ